MWHAMLTKTKFLLGNNNCTTKYVKLCFFLQKYRKEFSWPPRNKSVESATQVNSTRVGNQLSKSRRRLPCPSPTPCADLKIGCAQPQSWPAHELHLISRVGCVAGIFILFICDSRVVLNRPFFRIIKKLAGLGFYRVHQEDVVDEDYIVLI